MGCAKYLLIVVVFCLLISVVNAKPQSITGNQLTITSNKDVYYCEPIYNENGECLVKAIVNVTNNRHNTINLDAHTSFTSSIKNTDFIMPNGKKAKKAKKGKKGKKNNNAIDKIQIKKGESLSLSLEFWTNKSGKFNYTVNAFQLGNNNLLGSLVLDPYYNFSVQSSNPSWHLLNGSIENDLSINDYESKINITAGISDNSSATRYLTRVGENTVTNYYYQFNDDSQNSLTDSSGNENPLTLLPYADILDYNDFYSLHTTQNNGGGAKAITRPEFEISASDFTMGLIVKVDNSTAFTKFLLFHYSYPSGYYLYADTTWKVRAIFRDISGSYVSLSSTTTINDSNPHSIIVRRNITSGLIELIIDGSQESTATFNGVVNSTYDLEVGSKSSYTGFNGYIDEVFLTEQWLSNSTISAYNNNKYLYEKDKGDSIQVFFDRVINTSNSYSLKINKYDDGVSVIRIYSSKNMTDINNSDYIDYAISKGENYVNIDSIVYDNYNYPFRINSISADTEISDIYLLEVGNDTEPPTINSVSINDTNISCNDSILITANITDNSFVSSAYITWGNPAILNFSTQLFREYDGIWTTELSPEEMHIIFESLNWSFDMPINISLIEINATDVSGNTAYDSSIDVWGWYWCIECIPSWAVQYDSCLTNDTRLKYYTDSNTCNSSYDLPSDNGTYLACDYCTADIYKEYTSECFNNGSYYVINYTWADNEYWSCCIITNLPTDCPTQYSPYNVSGQEYCTFTEDDFDVDYDSEVYFGLKTDDKVYWKFNLNDTNNSYDCISYVKRTDGDLLQVNPQHTQKTDSIIHLSGSQYEDREYFQTHNGIGNVYFTKENLIIDGRVYIFGVECSGNSQTLKSERLVNVLYENVNAPITRWFWFKENITPITLFVLLSMFGVITLALVIAKVKGR